MVSGIPALSSSSMTGTPAPGQGESLADFQAAVNQANQQQTESGTEESDLQDAENNPFVLTTLPPVPSTSSSTPSISGTPSTTSSETPTERFNNDISTINNLQSGDMDSLQGKIDNLEGKISNETPNSNFAGDPKAAVADEKQLVTDINAWNADATTAVATWNDAESILSTNNISGGQSQLDRLSEHALGVPAMDTMSNPLSLPDVLQPEISRNTAISNAMQLLSQNGGGSTNSNGDIVTPNGTVAFGADGSIPASVASGSGAA